MKKGRVLVFGTFDGLHPGHKFFLRSAKSRGEHLIVGVARDTHVRALKQKSPMHHEGRRLETVKGQKQVDEAFLCDEELGCYAIVQKTEPDIIILGHDQTELEKDLLRWMSETDQYIPMTRIKKL